MILNKAQITSENINMKMSTNLRVSDQNAFSLKNRKDFTVRRHGLSTVVVYKLIFFTLVICAATTFLVYNQMMLGAQITTLIGLVLYIFAKQLEKHKRSLAFTEFLNAMLSSALAKDHKFCMIVKQSDGQIVYLNRDFQKTFPEIAALPMRTLDILLNRYNFAAGARKSILQATTKGAVKTVNTEFKGPHAKKTQEISFVIEPIQRPVGFSLIRGK